MAPLNLNLMNNLIEGAKTRRPGTYKEIGAEVGLHYRAQMGRALGIVAEECRRRGLPLVVALAINKQTGMPSGEFFQLATAGGEYSGSPDPAARRRFWEGYLERMYEAWKDIPPYAGDEE